MLRMRFEVIRVQYERGVKSKKDAGSATLSFCVRFE